MTEEIKNRIDVLFPSIYNKVEEISNDNTLETNTLWAKMSDKVADKCKKILAPLGSVVLDVQTDLQVVNADACPVVGVEVINSVGDALVDTNTWDSTAVNSSVVNVQMHRISRPFKLTAYDLQHGERVEGKITAAAETVAQGVVAQFAAAIEDIDAETISEFSPAAAAEMSGIFDTETNALLLSPAQYSKIVPTNSLALDPAAQGAYGINKIFKSVGTGDIVAMTADAVAGAIATPAVLMNHGTGLDVRVIGSIAGFPLVLKSKFDWDETLHCSVEVMAGFTVANSAGIKVYSVGEAEEEEEEPVGSN